MIERLVPTFEINPWDSVDDNDRFKMELKASYKPSYFWNNSNMGNLSLWDSQVSILDDFYLFDEETALRVYNELLFDAGRGGGKTTMASIILLTELYRMMLLDNPQRHYNIIPGDPITLFTSAAGYKQTLATIFPKIKALLTNSPWFMQNHKLIHLVQDKIKFPKNLVIEAVGSNMDTAQGRNVKGYVGEEINSVGTETGKITPADMYDKTSKGTTRFAKWNEDVRVAISSQTSTYDFLSQRIQHTKDNDIPGVLIVRASSLELNPNMTKEALERDKMRNEDSYNMEYGAGEFGGGRRYFSRTLLKRFKYGSNLFTVPELISVTRNEEFVPEFIPSDFKYDENASFYYMSTDPAVVNDAYGIAVMHKTIYNQVIVDGATVFRAAKNGVIDAERVKGFTEKILDVVPVTVYLYDIYQYSNILQMVANRGITLEQHHLNLADWEQYKDHAGNGDITIPKFDYLDKEFTELIEKNGKVDHPPFGTKDCADATVNGATYVYRQEPTVKGNQIYVGMAMQHR